LFFSLASFSKILKSQNNQILLITSKFEKNHTPYPKEMIYPGKEGEKDAKEN
jgi:hypothetical protein